MVERHLAKVHVARSNRVTRFEKKRKGGRVVECIGFENRRSCETTGGSNPPFSGNLLLEAFCFFNFYYTIVIDIEIKITYINVVYRIKKFLNPIFVF